MKYLHFQLQIRANEVVQVTLSQSAFLRLLDDENYVYYRRGDQYHYHGGMASGSPAVIKPPVPGAWHLTIDLGGQEGDVKATVHVISEVEPNDQKGKKRGFFNR